MKKLAAIILLLAALLGGVAVYQHRSVPRPDAPSLTVFCAAGLKKPVEAVAKQYQEESGVEVRLQFGGTGTLLSSLRVAKKGDLFIAADDGAVADARQNGLVREVLPVAIQRPVIAVRKDNPKQIRVVADLLRDDVKVALANPEAASISRVSKKALGDQWEKLAAHATVMKTVMEIAADISLGTVDAGTVWDALFTQFKDIQAVEVPELSSHPENASACVLAFTTQPAATLRFARYLTAPEKGGAIFQQNGFKPAGGDKWADKPALIFHSGGVDRLAVEGPLHKFAE